MEEDKGVVCAFDFLKGYGFIRRKKGKDVFFYFGDIASDDKHISVGDEVSFNLDNSGRGPKAIRLKIITAAS